jgi:hypothetical protein
MSKRLMTALVALLVVGLAVGAAIASGQGRNNEFTASMAGSKEKPTAGPSAAKGTFTVEFKNGQACYTMSVRGLGDVPIAAHIHKGGSSVAGPVVIDLQPAFKGTSPRVSKKCVPAKAAVVSAIKKNPSGYYANVHTKKNPAGAARGQLSAHT